MAQSVVRELFPTPPTISELIAMPDDKLWGLRELAMYNADAAEAMLELIEQAMGRKNIQIYPYDELSAGNVTG